MEQDSGRSGFADRATHEPSPDGLGHSVGIANAWDCHVHGVVRDPLVLSFHVGDKWERRPLCPACVLTVIDCHLPRLIPRNGIEAGTGETAEQARSRSDESPVGNADAPNPNPKGN